MWVCRWDGGRGAGLDFTTLLSQDWPQPCAHLLPRLLVTVKDSTLDFRQLWWRVFKLCSCDTFSTRNCLVSDNSTEFSDKNTHFLASFIRKWEEEGAGGINHWAMWMYALKWVPSYVPRSLPAVYLFIFHRGVRVFLWRRDIPDGQECKCQVTFLGAY